MPCETGCLCDDCCTEAKAFAFGHWNLQQYDDYADSSSRYRDWIQLEDGLARRKHNAGS